MHTCFSVEFEMDEYMSSPVYSDSMIKVEIVPFGDSDTEDKYGEQQFFETNQSSISRSIFSFTESSSKISIGNSNKNNPWPFIKKYYTFNRVRGNNVEFRCVICAPKTKFISTSVRSMYNLKRHMSRVHPYLSEELNNLILTATERKRHRSSSDEDTQPKLQKIDTADNTIISQLKQQNIDNEIDSRPKQHEIDNAIISQPKQQNFDNEIDARPKKHKIDTAGNEVDTQSNQQKIDYSVDDVMPAVNQYRIDQKILALFVDNKLPLEVNK